MHANFWHQCWDKQQIGFHESSPNPILINHIHALQLSPQQRIFLPLCGKTLDIAWLLAQGYRVVGAELSELAIKQLFEALNIDYRVIPLGNITHYQAHHLDIFVGDIFALTADHIGEVDAIYDRGGLVALPDNMRQKYTQKLLELTQKAQQLLVAYDYDQRLMQGPPFAITMDELNTHYQADYKIQNLEGLDAKERLETDFPTVENVWLLTPD